MFKIEEACTAITVAWMDLKNRFSYECDFSYKRPFNPAKKLRE